MFYQKKTFISTASRELVECPYKSVESQYHSCSGTDTEFCIPDHWVQAAVMVKIRTFKLNPDLFRTTFWTFPDLQSFYPFKSLKSGEKCQKWLKTVKNDQTIHVFTYNCSKPYFEPFQAPPLVTYPIIHRHSLPHIIWYVFIKSYQGHPKKIRT